MKRLLTEDDVDRRFDYVATLIALLVAAVVLVAIWVFGSRQHPAPPAPYHNPNLPSSSTSRSASTPTSRSLQRPPIFRDGSQTPETPTGQGATPSVVIAVAGSPSRPAPVAEAPTPAVPTSTATRRPPTSGQWARLVDCESSTTNANTGNGFFGYFQFNLATWRSNGGTGYPTDHSRAEQQAVASLLYDRRGAAPWPVCGKWLSR